MFDNLIKFKIRKTIIVLVLLLVTLYNSQAEEPRFIFSGKSGLSPGWVKSPWPWMTVITFDHEMARSPGGQSIRIDYENEAKKPWGGASFLVKDTQAFTGAVKVKESDFKKGALRFYINGGKDILGRFQGGQDIQVLLKFVKTDGTIQRAKQFVRLNPYIENNRIDDVPGTWQKVSIPLKIFVDKDQSYDGIQAIISFLIQFYGSTIPQSGIYITDIGITDGDKPAKAGGIVPGREVEKPTEDINFPEFSELPEYLKIKPNYEVKIEGPNYIVSGKPRFLIGTQISRLAFNGIEGRSTPGYAERYKWIYEHIPDFEKAQRLGFDTMGFFSSNNWLHKYDPGLSGEPRGSEARFDRFMKEIQLPLYVDFTMFPWAGGRLAETDKIPNRAKSDPSLKQHWLVYDPDNADGLQIYKDYWEYGTKRVVESGAYPLFYELFNEPSYFCECKDNRAKFAGWLRKKYKSVREMNKIWKASYESFESAGQFSNKTENKGLYIDFSKFLEDRFVEIHKEGIKTIKKIDKRKNPHITSQPLGFAAMDPYMSSFNYYKLSPLFDTIETPTGSGGIGRAEGVGRSRPAEKVIETGIPNAYAVTTSLTMSILRNIAKDKPIVNGESGYPPKTRKKMKNRYWIEMMRGINATYLFVWTRRAWDWKPNTPEGGKALAKRLPFLLLNPYERPVSSLAGIMDFKKEMLTVDNIVVPRPKGVRPEIALLYSYPSRLYHKISEEFTMADEMISYYSALEYSHYPFDTILEEQINDRDIQKNYRIIVAGGIDYVIPATRKKLEKFVSNGGILILGLKTLSHDEYGNLLPTPEWAGVKLLSRQKTEVGELSLSIPQTKLLPGKIRGLSYGPVKPVGSKVIGAIEDKPIITEKTYGKGKIYYIGALFRDYSLVSIISSILEKEKASIPAQVVDENGRLVPNVEMVLMDRGETKAIFLWNWDLYTKLGKIKLNGDFLTGPVYVFNPLDKNLYLSSSGKDKWDNKNLHEEGVYVPLSPQDRVLLVFSKKAWTKDKLTKVTADAIIAGYKKQRLEEQVAITERQKAADKTADVTQKARAFDVNPDDCFTINIRPYTNRGFSDKVEGDGKGGWTDQGRRNGLAEIKPGIHIWLNVPFDIIRWDQNRDTSCIVMKSISMKGGVEKVIGIPVQKQAKRLFFLHTAAWDTSGNKDKQSHKYIIRYSDGSSQEIIIRSDKENPANSQIGDWWKPKDVNPHTRVGWENSMGRGLYIYEWINPNPRKVIETIDVVSFGGRLVPIVVAISGEGIK